MGLQLLCKTHEPKQFDHMVKIYENMLLLLQVGNVWVCVLFLMNEMWQKVEKGRET